MIITQDMITTDWKVLSTSAFIQNGVIEPGFTLPPELKHLIKYMKRMVFKSLNIKQWRTMILKKWKINISPIITPAYCFEEFLDHVIGNACRTQDVSSFRKLSGEIHRPRCLEFIGQRIGRRKLERGNFRDRQMALLNYSAEYWLAHVCDETVEGQGTNWKASTEGWE